MKKTKTTAIIVGAGKGKRMGYIDKTFLKLDNKPVLSHALSVFEASSLISEIILVVRKDKIAAANNVVDKYNFKKVRSIVSGGASRQDSVYNALKIIKDADFVAVHDVARPFVTKQLLEKCICSARKYGVAIPATPAIDTIKKGDKNKFVSHTLERANLWMVQTPQVFKYKILKDAYVHARQNRISATDDASLVEKLDHKIKIVPSASENIKITEIAHFRTCVIPYK